MAAATHADPKLTALLADSEALAPAPVAAIARLRQAAQAALEGGRLPGRKDEEWRFTPLTALTEQRFPLGEGGPAELAAGALSRYALPETEGYRLVMVDGAFSPGLSRLEALPAGAYLGPLAEAPAGVLDAHLGTVADLGATEVFTALNGRYAGQGLALFVPRGVALPHPVQFLHVSTGTAPTASYPRFLVVLEAGAEATVVQTYVCLAEGETLTNSVTEIVLGDDAGLKHVRVQSESRKGVHIGRTAVRLGRASRYAIPSVTLGGRLSRFDLDLTQTAPGASVAIDGLTVLGGDQEADTHTSLLHGAPEGASRQLAKAIVAGAGHAVFNGKIVVAKGAQRTDSGQACRSLLLSPKARVDAKPELLIDADDVKCAHGAAVGQLDPEEIFYLRSRGLGHEQAVSLLTYAFAAEVLDAIPVPSLRESLSKVVANRAERARLG